MKNKYLYPSDMVVLFTTFMFSIFSFMNIGKIYINIFGVSVDRELLIGINLLVCIVIVLLMIKYLNGTQSKFWGFVRIFYIQVFYVILFTECIYISQLFFDGFSFDEFFANVDYHIFHFQPSIMLHKDFVNNKIVTEIFFFSYFVYYLLITAGWWILFFRGKKRDAYKTLWTVTASFCFLYIFYCFFPVQGPKYYFSELHSIWYSNFEGYFFTSTMKKMFSEANLGGAAFPSSHVAISLIALFLNKQYNKKLIPIILPITITLFISTVYIYAHYFIDILGGLFFGILLYMYIPSLYEKFEKINISFLNKVFQKFNFKEIE